MLPCSEAREEPKEGKPLRAWYPYYSYGGYAGGCDWLYRNAVTIGSSYRWNRYYACAGNAY